MVPARFSMQRLETKELKYLKSTALLWFAMQMPTLSTKASKKSYLSWKFPERGGGSCLMAQPCTAQDIFSGAWFPAIPGSMGPHIAMKTHCSRFWHVWLFWPIRTFLQYPWNTIGPLREKATKQTTDSHCQTTANCCVAIWCCRHGKEKQSEQRKLWEEILRRWRTLFGQWSGCFVVSPKGVQDITCLHVFVRWFYDTHKRTYIRL